MSSSSSLRSLAVQLRKLRKEELQLRSARKRLVLEREKLRTESAASEANENFAKKHFTSSSSSSSSYYYNSKSRSQDDDIVSHLPQNIGLEASIALLFSKGNGSRDPRIFLDVTQRLLGCTVLSLASNVTGKWDPFDIKPQVFALGKHMALPIFTSIRTLREFCWKHDFSVRGPDGSVWAQAGCAPPDALSLPPPSPSSSSAEPKSSKKKKQNQKSKKLLRQEKKRLKQEKLEQEEYQRKHAQLKEFRKLLDSASQVQQFEMKTVTPLFNWGYPATNYFHGYYGMLSTVLENASVLPGETDVVVNPATPLELALSHGLTSKHFSRNAAEYLVMQAFQRVEKEIRKEFVDFLSRYCPEVVSARSATIRKNLGFEDLEDVEARQGHRTNADMEFFQRNGLTSVVSPELLKPNAFDLVVLLETRNYEKTTQSVQNAKKFGILIGHVALRVLPLQDAPPHVVEMSEIFYSGSEEKDRKRSLKNYHHHQELSSSSSSSSTGENAQEEGLQLMGDSVFVNSHISSHNLYSDPRMAYTEAHAMALKRK